MTAPPDVRGRSQALVHQRGHVAHRPEDVRIVAPSDPSRIEGIRSLFGDMQRLPNQRPEAAREMARYHRAMVRSTGCQLSLSLAHLDEAATVAELREREWPQVQLDDEAAVAAANADLWGGEEAGEDQAAQGEQAPAAPAAPPAHAPSLVDEFTASGVFLTDGRVEPQEQLGSTLVASFENDQEPPVRSKWRFRYAPYERGKTVRLSLKVERLAWGEGNDGASPVH